MTHQTPEEPPVQKDRKKLQKQEQQVLEKLAEAREVQTRALKRFAQAQARVMQMETRLQAVRERLAASRTSHKQKKAAPVPETPAESLPGTGALEPLDVCAEDQEAESQTAQRSTPPSSPPPEPEEAEVLLAEIARLATQRTSGDEANEGRRDAREADRALDEVSQAILNGTLSGKEADAALQEAEQQTNQARTRLAEIEHLTSGEVISAITEMTENAETASAGAQDTSATDITTKIPVIRQSTEEQP